MSTECELCRADDDEYLCDGCGSIVCNDCFNIFTLLCDECSDEERDYDEDE